MHTLRADPWTRFQGIMNGKEVHDEIIPVEAVPSDCIRLGRVACTEETEKMEIAGKTAYVQWDRNGKTKFHVKNAKGVRVGPYTLDTELVS